MMMVFFWGGEGGGYSIFKQWERLIRVGLGLHVFVLPVEVLGKLSQVGNPGGGPESLSLLSRIKAMPPKWCISMWQWTNHMPGLLAFRRITTYLGKRPCHYALDSERTTCPGCWPSDVSPRTWGKDHATMHLTENEPHAWVVGLQMYHHKSGVDTSLCTWQWTAIACHWVFAETSELAYFAHENATYFLSFLQTCA